MNSSDKNLRNGAFKALQYGNKSILRTVADSPIVQNSGKGNVTEENVDNLAIIIETALSTFPELIRTQFKFIPSLIKYINHSSIEYMFQSLLSSEERLLPIHNFLKFIEFPKYVAFTAMKAEGEEKLLLMKLLQNCIENRVLMSSSVGSDAISLIKSCISSDNNEYRKFSFKFLYQAVIIDDYDEEIARLFIPDAIDAFSCTLGDYYYEYQVMAIKFLSRLIELRPVTTISLESDNVVQSLSEIFVKFNSHSFALSAVFEMIYKTIDDALFRQSIFNIFLPLVLNAIKEPASSTQHSFALRFLHDLEVIARRDILMQEELTQDIKSAFATYCQPFDDMIRSDSPVRSGELYDDIMDVVEIPFAQSRQLYDSQGF